MTTFAGTAADAPSDPAVSNTAAHVSVRLFAAAKALRGTGEETWTVPAGATIADALAALGLADDPVFARSSFLLDGRACTAAEMLVDGASLDVLPPFAGG